jgi:hypothetical protein
MRIGDLLSLIDSKESEADSMRIELESVRIRNSNADSFRIPEDEGELSTIKGHDDSVDQLRDDTFSLAIESPAPRTAMTSRTRSKSPELSSSMRRGTYWGTYAFTNHPIESDNVGQ